MKLFPRPYGIAFLIPGVAMLCLFFLLPLAAVVAESFDGAGRAYLAFARDPVFWKGFRGTLLLGLLSPLFSVVAGYCVATFLSRQSERRRMAYLFVISLPLTFSGLIVAYGFILVFGRAGFVTLLAAKLGADPATLAGFIYSPVGLGFAYSYYLIPRAVLVILPALLNFSQDQILAARSLGASTVTIYRDIILPQLAAPLVTAFCLTAAVAIGAYGTALALVGTQVNILPLLLFSKISDTGSDFPAAAAMSVLLMAICVCVIAIAEIFFGREKAEAV